MMCTVCPILQESGKVYKFCDIITCSLYIMQLIHWIKSEIQKRFQK